MKKLILTIFLSLITMLGFSQDSYTLSSESKLIIEGTSTVHDWTVTANTLNGTLLMDRNAPKEINFEVAVADIKSERGATMDKKMHAALQKDLHPKVIFTLKKVINEATTLIGTLLIAGKEQEVEINGAISSSGNTLKISGEYGFALKDFEIEPPTAMFGQVIVGPDITVKFELFFIKE